MGISNGVILSIDEDGVHEEQVGRFDRAKTEELEELLATESQLK